MILLSNVFVFVIFVFLQSLSINGIKSCFDKGMIFYSVGVWMELNIKKDWIKKPVYKCTRCMSSFWGFITFWPFYLFAYGFRIEEIFVFIFDITILVSLNFLIYKKL